VRHDKTFCGGALTIALIGSVFSVWILLDTPAWFDIERCTIGTEGAQTDLDASGPFIRCSPFMVTMMPSQATTCQSISVKGEFARCLNASSDMLSLVFPCGVRSPTTITMPPRASQWGYVIVHAGGLFNRHCTNVTACKDYPSVLKDQFDSTRTNMLLLKAYPDIMRAFPLGINVTVVMSVVDQVRVPLCTLRTIELCSPTRMETSSGT